MSTILAMNCSTDLTMFTLNSPNMAGCTEMVRYKGILGSSYLKLGIRQKVRIYVVSFLNSWLVEMKKPKYTLVKFAFVHPFRLDMFRTQVLF